MKGVKLADRADSNSYNQGTCRMLKQMSRLINTSQNIYHVFRPHLNHACMNTHTLKSCIT